MKIYFDNKDPNIDNRRAIRIAGKNIATWFYKLSEDHCGNARSIFSQLKPKCPVSQEDR